MHSHGTTENSAACRDAIVVRLIPDKRALIKAFVENKGMAEAAKSGMLESITPFGFTSERRDANFEKPKPRRFVCYSSP